MKFKNPCLTGRQEKSKIKIIILVFSLWSLVFGLVGCEAFVRKFTRKPKREELPREEMVLAPEEYKAPQIPKEQLYRQYLLFWKSWQDELIASLSKGTSHKKQIDCANEAMKNLLNLRALLNADKQKKLDLYLGQLNELKDLITQDLYGNSLARNRQDAERIRRNILRDFPYKKIKDNLI